MRQEDLERQRRVTAYPWPWTAWAYQPGVGWHRATETYPAEAVIACTGARVRADYFCTPHPREHRELPADMCPACAAPDTPEERETPGDGGEE